MPRPCDLRAFEIISTVSCRRGGKFMNSFFRLQLGLVRPDTCRPTCFNQAKLAGVIVAMLALSTTCADAGKRDDRKAPRPAAHQVNVARLPNHAAPEPYWMYRRCSPGARAADPYTVCFPPNTVRPYLGRDPD